MEGKMEMVTESRNPRTERIDSLDTLSVLRLINEEDREVPAAVERELANIAQAVDGIVPRLRAGGRLIYCGAGTSGRMGVLDAVECGPTYGAQNVIGVLAGGRDAMFRSQEGAEDSPELGRADLAALRPGPADTVVGIAASGQTPYVLGALEYARGAGAATVALCCNPDSPVARAAQLAITPVVGPEVITGSTRMKAGTAQKLVLNMLSTAVMIRLGKVYGNLMVDVRPTNEKLRERAVRIVTDCTGAGSGEAKKALETCHFDVKTAILTLLTGRPVREAAQYLDRAGGRVRDAIRLATEDGSAGGRPDGRA